MTQIQTHRHSICCNGIRRIFLAAGMPQALPASGNTGLPWKGRIRCARILSETRWRLLYPWSNPSTISLEHQEGAVRPIPDPLEGGSTMSMRGVYAFAPAGASDTCCGEEDVIEIPLLLPHWQVEALESAAHKKGLTAGEMIRQLLLDYLARQASREQR